MSPIQINEQFHHPQKALHAPLLPVTPFTPVSKQPTDSFLSLLIRFLYSRILHKRKHTVNILLFFFWHDFWHHDFEVHLFCTNSLSLIFFFYFLCMDILLFAYLVMLTDISVGSYLGLLKDLLSHPFLLKMLFLVPLNIERFRFINNLF